MAKIKQEEQEEQVKQVKEQEEEETENNEKTEEIVSGNGTVVSGEAGQMGGSNGENGERTPEIKQENVREYFTLIEAYQLMLKGAEFRFEEWNKNHIPYVARVVRGRTTISLTLPDRRNVNKSFTPSQAEALKKLWYQVK